MLDHESTVSDENLFAATIILRVLEEIDGTWGPATPGTAAQVFFTVQLTGEDAHGHLLGIHAFVGAGNRYMIPDSLSAACFWVGLRQEIYSAVINHKVVRMSLNQGIVDRGTGLADDETWANRAVVHCADVLNFCFGEAAGDAVRWRELENATKEWKAALPPTYTPIYFRDREEPEAFQEIWYHKTCQGTAPGLRRLLWPSVGK